MPTSLFKEAAMLLPKVLYLVACLKYLRRTMVQGAGLAINCHRSETASH